MKNKNKIIFIIGIIFLIFFLIMLVEIFIMNNFLSGENVDYGIIKIENSSK